MGASRRTKKKGLASWSLALNEIVASALKIAAPLPEHGGARAGSGRMSREAMIAAYTSAFEDFLADDAAVKAAIDGSTSSHLYTERESWVVELFRDGSHRVLSGKEYEDGYRSPGLVIAIPPLQDEDLPPPDAPLISRFYDNALNELRRNFDEAVADYRNA